MSYFIRRINGWGVDNAADGTLVRESITLATSAVTSKFTASITTLSTRYRQRIGVNVAYTGATTEFLYGRIVKKGAAAPTVSSTNYDFVVTGGSEKPVQCGPDLDIYVKSSAAGSTIAILSEFSD